MEEPVKIYHPSKKIFIICIILILISVLSTIRFAFFYQPDSFISRFIVLESKIVLIPLILGFFICIMILNSQMKRTPIIKIFKNYVVFIYPKLNNLSLKYTKKDLSSMSTGKLSFYRYIGFKFKNPKKVVNDMLNHEFPPVDIWYKLVHYLVFKLKRKTMKFTDFDCKTKKDKYNVNYNIFMLNEKKTGFHKLLLSTFYPQKRLFVDLNKCLYGKDIEYQIQKEKKSVLAVSSFIISVVSFCSLMLSLLLLIFFGWSTPVMMISILLFLIGSIMCFLALIFGILSIFKLKKDKTLGGIGYSIMGILLSLICIYVVVLINLRLLVG